MALTLAGTPDNRGHISPTLVPSLDVKKVVFGRCLPSPNTHGIIGIVKMLLAKFFGRLDEW